MKIEVGKYAGFCRGVKEAVNKTFSVSRESRESIYTDGELIHNPQTLKLLESCGVQVFQDGAPMEQIQGKTVIIRAHGVSPERRRLLKRSAKQIKNYTCRDVARVQSSIKKWSGKGYSIVIFGKKSHPEVVGLMGYARDGYVIYSDEDIAGLPKLDKVFFVSQTTMDQEQFLNYSDQIRSRFAQVEVENTICSATEQRQDEVKSLARRNDALLVIGGRKSSNSKRLYEIGSQYTRTFFIEQVSDLDSIQLAGVKKLGITAGASTPDWLIAEIIEEVQKRSMDLFSRLFRSFLNFVLHSNLMAALGAFMLSFAVADLLKSSFSLNVGLIVALYYFSMSLMNSFTNRLSFRIDNPSGYNFIFRYRYLFFGLFILSITTILYRAFLLGETILMITVFAIILGTVYNFSFLPLKGFLRKLMFFRKWDLLGLKSLVLAFAVTMLLNGLTLFQNHEDIWEIWRGENSFLLNFGFYFSVYYVFMLMFSRQVLFELKSSQTDRITGVSSLINLLRPELVRTLLYALPAFLILVMLLAFITGIYPETQLKYFIAVLYNELILLFVLRKQTFLNRSKYAILIESNLFIAGIISLF